MVQSLGSRLLTLLSYGDNDFIELHRREVYGEEVEEDIDIGECMCEAIVALGLQNLYCIAKLKCIDQLDRMTTCSEVFVFAAQVQIACIFNTYGLQTCIDDGKIVSNFAAQVCSSFLTYFTVFCCQRID